MSQGISMTIDPIIMRDAAQSVESLCSSIENCLGNIVREANSLKSEWEGESADVYQAAVQKISENSPSVVGMFQEYAQDLKSIADKYITDEIGRETGNETLPDTAWPD